MGQSSRKDTRGALVRSAERLIAEKGLGSVSVKMITTAAGARNPSAVHYHFGSIEQLIREVFAARYRTIEEERVVRLAKIDEADPHKRLVALMEASIGPFMEACLEEDGRLYASFCLQFAADPRFDLTELVAEEGAKSFLLLRGLLSDCLHHVPADLLLPRLRQGFVISLAQGRDFARRVEDGTAPPVKEAIHEAAICTAAYLAAPAGK